MYQRLQNLWQNTRSVDDYTTEFFQLVGKTDLTETEDQQIARYVDGLHQQFQDELNMCDLYSVSDAHQRALSLERRNSRRLTAGNWNIVARTPTITALTTCTGNSLPMVQITAKTSTSGFKCFKCGEPGHHAVDCRKSDRTGKALFTDAEENQGDLSAEYDQMPTYDDGDEQDVATKPQVGEAANLLARAEMEEEIAESGIMFVLIGKEADKGFDGAWSLSFGSSGFAQNPVKYSMRSMA
ncbi:hypothetical protein Vadar_000176 [Vaccinium darrowii]|uniref:Uncharacterized protein n=1 Tax=Vaccinium darrowii TaxID=229202 RepID=A0ACB7YAY5_9ERIC|nr:hypothetical protein Vadar_000176 [Vaccinium darrowii]